MPGAGAYQPTDGLSYDPSDSVYWDEGALAKETRRVFEVCNGCRMCFKFCDTFPTLFELIDEKYSGDVAKLDQEETARVMDGCFQCKLCEVQCPYTPREQHEFKLDFPRLVHRHRAVEYKRTGGNKLRDRLLADPDKAGRLARATGGLANVMNRVKPHRWLLEKLLGIHRAKLLPKFAGTTFERWAERRGLMRPTPRAEVVLFQTCYIQNNEPEIGRDTVDVLERNQVDVACSRGLLCCGMPAWEVGDLETLRKNARANLGRLIPFVRNGAKVVVINPTCTMMMRREHPQLLEGADRLRAEELAEAVMDPSEFLWSIRGEERFNTDFKSSPNGKLAYHMPCHLRAQMIGFKGRDLMRKIPKVLTVAVMECCGHDGTYAMKVESYEASKRIGKKAFDGMQGHQADVWVTDCPLAAIQF
ncbi:MAG: heterodisulfide reductase-related iron-sulfur binding cluster [Planctomycetota bacterium]|nr:heterodisulfide reductase-related iron-sulfur binding cluster [Planctomycetota bacterium]